MRTQPADAPDRHASGRGLPEAHGWRQPRRFGGCGSHRRRRGRVEDAPAGRMRHAIEIAGNAYHALVRDAPFELENRSVGRERQRFEMWLFPGEGFVDDALRGRVDTGIGDRVEPMPELSVEIIEVAERTAEEEVLANNSGTAARPCPWSWPGKAGRLWAGSRNAGQGRRGCGCKPRDRRHPSPITAVFIRS
jgi:hypothetical protein